MNGEHSDAQRETATLDELEADIDLVDAAMTHVADGNLEAADAAVSALAGSDDRATAVSGPDPSGVQDEGAESVPDQPFRPAS